MEKSSNHTENGFATIVRWVGLIQALSIDDFRTNTWSILVYTAINWNNG